MCGTRIAAIFNQCAILAPLQPDNAEDPNEIDDFMLF